MSSKKSLTATRTTEDVQPDPPTPVDATADDLLSGYDDPYRPLTLPLKKNGQPLMVYLRPMSVAEVFHFSELGDDERSDGTLDLIAAVTVDNKGVRLFNGDHRARLRSLPASAYNALLAAIMGEMKVPEAGVGNVSSATPGGASSTASQPN